MYKYVILLISSVSLFAVDYLPLAVGNQWRYQISSSDNSISGSSDMAIVDTGRSNDTLYFTLQMIDTIVVNAEDPDDSTTMAFEKIFYLFETDTAVFIKEDLLRADSGFMVPAQFKAETLWVGLHDTIVGERCDCDSSPYVVADTFDTCWKMIHDEGYSETFAKGVGMISTEDSLSGISLQLESYTIVDTTIVAVVAFMPLSPANISRKDNVVYNLLGRRMSSGRLPASVVTISASRIKRLVIDQRTKAGTYQSIREN